MEVLKFLIIFLILILAACSKSPKITDPSFDNTPPKVSLGDDLTVPENETVSINSVASDENDLIVSYRWQQTEGPSINFNGNAFSVISFITPTAKTPLQLKFKLTVIDSLGAEAEDEISVTVQPVNQPPRVAAGADQLVNEGNLVVITSTAVDTDGDIVGHQWLDNAAVEELQAEALQGETSSKTVNGIFNAEYRFQAPKVITRTTLEFALQVTDDEGGLGEAISKVTILPVNDAPVIIAPDSIDTYEDTPFEIEFKTEDSDGFITEYQWAQIEGPKAELINTNDSKTSYILKSVSSTTNLKFRLSVQDNEGAKQEKVVEVNVNPLALMPISGASYHMPVFSSSRISATRLHSDGTHLTSFSDIAEADALGFFQSSIKGPGLYEFSSQARYTNSLRNISADGEVVFKSLTNVTGEQHTLRIDLLTHLIHARVLNLISIDGTPVSDALSQAKAELSLALKEYDLFDLHMLFQEQADDSLELSPATVKRFLLTHLLFNYANSRSSEGNYALELSSTIEYITSDFANNGVFDKSTGILNEIKNTQSNINPLDIAAWYTLTTNTPPNNIISLINQFIDTDRDGIINTLDEDDDNDSQQDAKDMTPYGEESEKSICSDNFDSNPITNNSRHYYIQNIWRPDFYLNAVDELDASPIPSRYTAGSVWRLERSETNINNVRIIRADTGEKLTIDRTDGASLALVQTDNQDLETFDWTITNIDINNDSQGFYIQDIQDPDVYLSISHNFPTLISTKNIVTLHDGVTPDWMSTRWRFCEADENIVSHLKPTPNDYNRPICTEHESPNDGEVYHLQNRWYQGQYLIRGRRVSSSPIFSKHDPGSRWRIKKADNPNSIYIISEMDDGLYLYANRKIGSLMTGSSSLLEEADKSWELSKISSSSPSRPIYHISNNGSYLTSNAQWESLFATDNYIVQIRDDHLDEWFSSQWLFCRAD